MLSAVQKEEFREKGFVRIEGAFSEEGAIPMRELIYGELENQCGSDRNDRSTWNSQVWPKFHAIKYDPVFDPIGGESTKAVLDDLLGDWQEPSNWGQFLVSLPEEEKWQVTYQLWHTDFGFDTPVDPLPGILFISFISDVGPKSGGTGAISGGHHLVRKFVDSRDTEFCMKMRRVREALMESDPWLVALADPDAEDREERFLNNETVVNGCPVRVCELTGKTGDIIIGHPWLLHTLSSNCGEAVSMRRVQRIKAKTV